jgi:hypothetical protein
VRAGRLLFGVIAGVAAGDLVLGLNPQLFAPLAAGRLLLVFALAGGLLATPLLLAPGRASRASSLRQSLLALLCVSYGLFVEGQRTLHYGLLRNGARRVLVATSIVSAVVAILCLCRARWRGVPAQPFVGAALVLFLLPPLFARRAPESALLASPAPLPRASRRSLLVVGLEGVSWDLISAGASDGSLPVLARLLKEGSAGSLASPRPYDRAALWTTAATGKLPVKHGVVSSQAWSTPAGELRLLPRLPGASAMASLPLSPRRPLSGEARRSLAFWEILARRGHEVALLNWPASHPAQAGLVLWASEQAFEGTSPAGAALPLGAAQQALLFRVDVATLDRPLVRTLSPEGLTSADDRGAPLEGAARDLSVLGAALVTVPAGPGSVSALVLSGAVGVARRFSSAGNGGYWGVFPPDPEAEARALKAYYRFLDDAVGELVEHEGRDRTICVFSPVSYGPPPALDAFASFVRGRAPGASPEGSRDGFLVLSGSGIRAGVRLTSANVLDLAPTLLVLAGEPVARDFDGRVLAEAFDERFTESASVPIITTFEPKGPQ